MCRLVFHLVTALFSFCKYCTLAWTWLNYGECLWQYLHTKKLPTKKPQWPQESKAVLQARTWLVCSFTLWLLWHAVNLGIGRVTFVGSLVYTSPDAALEGFAIKWGRSHSLNSHANVNSMGIQTMQWFNVFRLQEWSLNPDFMHSSILEIHCTENSKPSKANC